MLQTRCTCCCNFPFKMYDEKSETEVKSVCGLDRIFLHVLVLILFARPILPGYVWGSASRDWRNTEELAKMPLPQFEDTEIHVTVSPGRSAFLPCRVRNISDKVVSWIRTKDLHILTSGPHTFTADPRFESSNTLGSSNWGLRLRNAQASDTGTYECQVNTDPKMNRKVTLNVDINLGDSPYSAVEPHMADAAIEEGLKKGSLTRILGSEEQYVKTGSTVTFTCLAMSSDLVPSAIEWFKNGRQVSFQAARGGISVDTERTEKKTTSRLTVADVRPEDSGNYTCKAAHIKPHSIVLIVIEGEQTQAMQRNRNGNASLAGQWTVLVALLCTKLAVS